MSEDADGLVFDAPPDPMRRRLPTEMSAQPATATELPISLQAVAKHLSSLTTAGVGARERAWVTPEPLAGAISWMTRIGADSNALLRRLEESLSRPD